MRKIKIGVVGVGRGKKGRMETYRDDVEELGVCRLITNLDEYDGGYETTVKCRLREHSPGH